MGFGFESEGSTGNVVAGTDLRGAWNIGCQLGAMQSALNDPAINTGKPEQLPRTPEQDAQLQEAVRPHLKAMGDCIEEGPPAGSRIGEIMDANADRVEAIQKKAPALGNLKELPSVRPGLRP